MSTKINIGCGEKYLSGYINCDVCKNIKTDMSFDLTQLPWPFPDNYADEIIMIDVLEHLRDSKQYIIELHRILKPNGILRIDVPYAFSDGAVQAYDHKAFFTEKSLDSFCGKYKCFILGDPLFKMLKFRFLSVKNTPRSRLRNLIPCRRLLRHFLRNMYDGLSWELQKIDPTKPDMYKLPLKTLPSIPL